MPCRPWVENMTVWACNTNRLIGSSADCISLDTSIRSRPALELLQSMHYILGSQRLRICVGKLLVRHIGYVTVPVKFMNSLSRVWYFEFDSTHCHSIHYVQHKFGYPSRERRA